MWKFSKSKFFIRTRTFDILPWIVSSLLFDDKNAYLLWRLLTAAERADAWLVTSAGILIIGVAFVPNGVVGFIKSNPSIVGPTAPVDRPN